MSFGIILVAVMVLLMIASIPIGFAIILASIFGLWHADLLLIIVPQKLFQSLDYESLLALPLFILAGNIMEAAGISRRLVEFAKSIVGGVQGGLPLSCVVTCMIFAAVSGSSVATTFAVGSILIPALVQHGYPRPFAASVQATSAELGVIIPPSIPMILYGVTAEVSIGELFIAGIGPGVLIGLSLLAYVFIWCRVTGHGLEDRKERLPFSKAVVQAAFPLGMPVLILGGIYGGIFTPTEAAAVAVIYALILGVFVYRQIGFADIARVFERSLLSTSVIMLIIAAAGLFGYLVTLSGAPTMLTGWLIEFFHAQWSFLLAITVFLFIVGMFFETSAAILILVPILAPAATAFGIDPIHFGILMIVNLALGMVTPPFGVNLFAASAVANVRVEHMIRSLVPFVLVVLACLFVIAYVPAVPLFLRDLAFR
ncbi:TRAP transporter large permease [Acuticoccus kandeliae]|uniref:TRAP transporter large permease n=1 Tax=Acuticoccus kandeliae TaxID=2073160 RepID=UPI001FE90F72|nr:TRAP transporter large permease [Acuticoccus kandeliae]